MLAVTLFIFIFQLIPIKAEWSSIGGTPLNRRCNSVDTPTTNRTSWVYTGCQTFRHAPIISNTSIYFGCNNTLNKMSAKTGKLLWSYAVSGEIHAAPAISNNGKKIYVGDYSGSVWVFQETGIRQQIFKGNSPISKGVLVSSDDKYIYLVSDKFYTLFSNNGTVVWTCNHLNPGLLPVIDSNGILYLSLGDGFLSAYSSSTGILRWRRSLGGTTTGNPSIAINGYIHIAVAISDMNVLYGYSPSGNRMYTVQLSTTVDNDLAIDKYGIIYVVSGKILYAVDDKNITVTFMNETCYSACVSNNIVIPCSTKIWGQLWSYNFGKIVQYAGCSISDNGIVYINTDKALYAFDPEEVPTNEPTIGPTINPTTSPTNRPTTSPTNRPTTSPTNRPTTSPTIGPTNNPTTVPTIGPPLIPTNSPSSITHENPGELAAAIIVPIITIIACGLFVVFYRRRIVRENDQNIPILTIVRKDDEPTKTSAPHQSEQRIYYTYEEIATLFKRTKTQEPDTLQLDQQQWHQNPEALRIHEQEWYPEAQPIAEQEWYPEAQPIAEQEWYPEAQPIDDNGPEEDYYNRNRDNHPREEE